MPKRFRVYSSELLDEGTLLYEAVKDENFEDVVLLSDYIALENKLSLIEEGLDVEYDNRGVNSLALRMLEPEFLAANMSKN